MADQFAHENKLVIKIVYYGPALSGKTTNIIGLHNLMDSSSCGDLMSFETKGDRTLFFDLLPLLVKAENSNLRIKIKLYTVPGQVAHDATRKAVLSRADGVVFVADSQKNQAVSNFESFDNLEKNAARVGLDLDRLPLVIQFNKRDLTDIVSRKEVIERWKPTGLPLFFSSALKHQGISETFEQVLMEVYRRLDQEFGLSTIHKVREKDFLSVVPNRVN
jgi:signal recognition particle receptor subunit beta